MRNSNGYIVGEGVTEPIVTTDNHRGSTVRAERSNRLRGVSASTPTASTKRRRKNQTDPSDSPPSPSHNDTNASDEHLLSDANTLQEAAGTTVSGGSEALTALTPNSNTAASFGSSPSIDTSAGHTVTSAGQSLGPLLSNPESASPPPPRILGVFENHGPLPGRNVVTIVGENFAPHHRCMFGPNVAWTNFRACDTLLCSVPPALAPGKVILTIEGFPIIVGGGVDGASDEQDLQRYEYKDDCPREL